jgi:hypothetical protein
LPSPALCCRAARRSLPSERATDARPLRLRATVVYLSFNDAQDIEIISGIIDSLKDLTSHDFARQGGTSEQVMLLTRRAAADAMRRASISPARSNRAPAPDLSAVTPVLDGTAVAVVWSAASDIGRATT